MTKYKLFTHTDLDGVGCAIVAHHLLGNVDVEYCDYHNVDEKISEYIASDQAQNYEATFITDISVNDAVADQIDKSDAKWRLIDHHPTALHLNEYRWAEVSVDEDAGKASGTSLFYQHLIDGERFGNGLVETFVEKVRRYDTWEWNTKFNDQHAKQLNDLLHIIGRDRFVDRFREYLSIAFTQSESLLLELEQEKIDAYVEGKAKQLQTVDIAGYKAGVVFAESKQSELGNELAKANVGLDFIAMINPSRSVSFRGVKDNVDLGKVAKQFGGGGHPKAAGAPVNRDAVNRFIDDIFTMGGD